MQFVGDRSSEKITENDRKSLKSTENRYSFKSFYNSGTLRVYDFQFRGQEYTVLTKTSYKSALLLNTGLRELMRHFWTQLQ